MNKQAVQDIACSTGNNALSLNVFSLVCNAMQWQRTLPGRSGTTVNEQTLPSSEQHVRSEGQLYIVQCTIVVAI